MRRKATAEEWAYACNKVADELDKVATVALVWTVFWLAISALIVA